MLSFVSHTPGRPTYAEQARKLRLERGLSQAEAAKGFRCNQPYISRLETNLAPLDDIKRYLDYLSQRTSRRIRHPGGGSRIGPKRVRPIDPKRYRGTPLISDSDLRKAVLGWHIVAVTRAATDMELVIGFDPQSDRYGLIAVRRRNRQVKADQPISFDAKYESMVGATLEAFASGRYPTPDLLPEADK